MEKAAFGHPTLKSHDSKCSAGIFVPFNDFLQK
jgi:hypothetical protein